MATAEAPQVGGGKKGGLSGRPYRYLRGASFQRDECGGVVAPQHLPIKADATRDRAPNALFVLTVTVAPLGLGSATKNLRIGSHGHVVYAVCKSVYNILGF